VEHNSDHPTHTDGMHSGNFTPEAEKKRDTASLSSHVPTFQIDVLTSHFCSQSALPMYILRPVVRHMNKASFTHFVANSKPDSIHFAGEETTKQSGYYAVF
jgi:hypothetical protein